jgi:hypothetical protein
MADIGNGNTSSGGAAGDTSKGGSQYRGVSWSERAQRWEVRVWGAGKQHFVGAYPTEVEAARAYDKAILKMRGSVSGTPPPVSVCMLTSGTELMCEQKHMQQVTWFTLWTTCHATTELAIAPVVSYRFRSSTSMCLTDVLEG